MKRGDEQLKLRKLRRDPRAESERANGRSFVRVIHGDAPVTNTHILHVPSIQVVFEDEGVPRRVEWLCADSAGDDCCPAHETRTRGENSIALSIREPGSPVTSVDLGGLVIGDNGCGKVRRIEPHHISEMVNLAGTLKTTSNSVLSYRVYDQHGEYAGTGLTRVTASFVLGQSFELHFSRFTNAHGKPGRISLHAMAAGVSSTAEPEPLVPQVCDRMGELGSNPEHSVPCPCSCS